MPFTDQDARNEIMSYQPPEDEHPIAQAPVSPLQAVQTTPATVTPKFLDGVISTADNLGTVLGVHTRMVRDVMASAVTGATNAADAVKSGLSAGPAVKESYDDNGSLTAEKDDSPAPDPVTPIYNDARTAVLGVRDAIAVKDPNVWDQLLMAAGQFAPSFTMFSRVVAGIHGLADFGAGGNLVMRAAGAAARFVAADTPNTMLMQGPHDPRLADMVQLARHSETKFGDVLKAVAPDDSLLGHYINYLADHTNESEAEGRWKNVIDSYNAGAAVSGILHVGGSILKQGWNALHFMADNNMGSMSDLAPPDPATDPSVPKGWGSAETGVQQDASPLEKDPSLTAARTFLKAQTDAGHEGSLHAMVSALSQHLDTSTQDGAFYKDIFDRLASKNLQTRITAPGIGLHKSVDKLPDKLAGMYSGTEDTIALYPRAFKSNESTAHILAHEAVHAATSQAIDTQPAVKTAIGNLIAEAKDNASDLGKDAYGFKNEKEFVAEAESNPKFQKQLKQMKSDDGRPLWDHYKEVIGGIFGLGAAAVAAPQFEKLLTGENKGA